MADGNLYDILQLESNGLTAVDLFCGAGIGAYGIKRAGYNILWAVDNDKNAVQTYNLNIGDHAICEDIRKIRKKDIPKHDLMIATPVCKPFSICGARRLTNDEKYGDLLSETIRLFSECLPKALFFENVAGLVYDASLPIFLDFVKQLESYDYHSYWDLVNCWDLGVPQERLRVFLVCIRNDILNEFISPKKLLFGKKVQKDAFYDLKNKTINDIKNHNTDFIKHFDNNMVVKHRQRNWNEPGFTVLSDANSQQYYPEPVITNWKDLDNLPRRLSVREHLRLQTVGDDFYFPDTVSINEQYFRCSGIPSLVAYKYGNAIADCLLGKTKIRQHTLRIKSLF